MEKEKQLNLRILAECAVMVALATVLSLVKIYEAPLGGAVTLFSMSPIILISCLHGTKWGLGTAFVYSVIQLILGLGSVAYVPSAVGVILCVLFDYIIPFTLVGLAGMYNSLKIKEALKPFLGALTVCLIRFACHVVSGAVVWYSITKEGQWNDLVNKFGMWTYSTVYNAQFMVPETIITLISASSIYMVLKLMKKKTAK